MIRWLVAGAALALLPVPALAHHAMGGATPETWLAGFVSGLGHPVIGIDHLAFVLLAGLVSAHGRAPYLAPFAFVAATLGGTALFLGGLMLPFAELAIAASVVVLGALAAGGVATALSARLLFFGAAGLYHGWAYGEGIVGAEPTPLAAYLLGFALVQYALAAGMVWLCTSRSSFGAPQATGARLAGAVGLGVGAVFLIEGIEGLIFA